MKTEQIWKEHPSLEVVYLTSDENAFYSENDAKNHAKTLEDKSVEPVYNPAHLSVEAEILEPGKEDELTKLTKDQLIQFAKDKCFEVNKKDVKEKIIESIQAQTQEKAQSEKDGDQTTGGDNSGQ